MDKPQVRLWEAEETAESRGHLPSGKQCKHSCKEKSQYVGINHTHLITCLSKQGKTK